MLTGGPVTWGPGFVPLGVIDGTGPAGAAAAGAGKLGAKDAAAVAEAQRYFTALGEMASRAGIAVDIVSGGGGTKLPKAAVDSLSIDLPLILSLQMLRRRDESESGG